MKEPDIRRTFKVIYGVSSVGLGHARRSVAIAEKLRSIDPNVQFDFDWLAAEPAFSFLERHGEKVLRISSKLESLSSFIEEGSKYGKIRDMSVITRGSVPAAKRNYQLIKPILGDFDILIQDEFVETLFCFLWDDAPALPKKRVVITDYVRFETSSLNPVNSLGIAYANKTLKKAYKNQHLRIFAEEEDALPESGRLRKWVRENFQIVGPVVENIPTESKIELKRKLLGAAATVRFIVFTIGGTSIGKELFQLITRDANRISEVLDAYLVLLIGSRVHPKSIGENTSNRLMIIPFTLEALGYFRAAECVVTQAGGSTLNEVASMGIPCVIIPIANHFEQQRNAKRFKEKFGFQVLKYEELKGPALVNAIQKAIASPYNPMKPARAALRAAGLIYDLALERKKNKFQL